MLDPHTSLGIAIVCLYVPFALVDGFLLFRRHSHPRMPWYFLFVFSLFRIASGILVALYPSNQSNIGIIIAAIITLGVGVIPLMMATMGMLRVIHTLSFAQDRSLQMRITYSRFAFFLGVALIAVGGGLTGEYQDPSMVSTGVTLAKVGYFVLVAVYLYLLGFAGYFATRRHELSHAARVVLVAIFAASPFIIVRLVYALLAEFTYGSDQWSALFGRVGPFVGMCFIMELVAACIYITAGYIIPPMRAATTTDRAAAKA